MCTSDSLIISWFTICTLSFLLRRKTVQKWLNTKHFPDRMVNLLFGSIIVTGKSLISSSPMDDLKSNMSITNIVDAHTDTCREFILRSSHQNFSPNLMCIFVNVIVCSITRIWLFLTGTCYLVSVDLSLIISVMTRNFTIGPSCTEFTHFSHLSEWWPWEVFSVMDIKWQPRTQFMVILMILQAGTLQLECVVSI